jgi:nucleotide-binding universal stress UspA family protein
MKEFVVGLDGSDHSRMALRWAAAAAQAAGVPVRAVQAWSHPRSAGWPVGPDAAQPDEMDERTQADIAATVADVLGPEAAGAPEATVRAEVLRGPAAGAILQTVAAGSVLVLGSRGRGGFAGLLLGSVSQECVEYAPCPVVVVRTDRALADGDVILVGKDGSPSARQALEWAHTLAGATGANVSAVHAWRATVSERPPRVGQRLRSRAERTVKGWTQGVSDEIESHEIEGDPRDVLVNAAQRFDPALTVVGRRGEGGVRSMLLGSTANHLVRQSSTNVAVVPMSE